MPKPDSSCNIHDSGTEGGSEVAAGILRELFTEPLCDDEFVYASFLRTEFQRMSVAIAIMNCNYRVSVYASSKGELEVERVELRVYILSPMTTHAIHVIRNDALLLALLTPVIMLSTVPELSF